MAEQVAALCWRSQGGLPEVLLITSRETGRWVIPKGWRIKGLTEAEAAAREAWEEAGVTGRVQDEPIGHFCYDKLMGSGQVQPCAVTVFGLGVDKLERDFPEKDERRRVWFPAAEAAGLVAEPDLRALLSALAVKAGALIGPSASGGA